MRLLIPNWRRVLTRASSLRAIEVTFVADFLLNFVPQVSDYLPRWATLLLLAVAYACRFIPQRSIRNADQ